MISIKIHYNVHYLTTKEWYSTKILLDGDNIEIQCVFILLKILLPLHYFNKLCQLNMPLKRMCKIIICKKKNKDLILVTNILQPHQGIKSMLCSSSLLWEPPIAIWIWTFIHDFSFGFKFNQKKKKFHNLILMSIPTKGCDLKFINLSLNLNFNIKNWTPSEHWTKPIVSG